MGAMPETSTINGGPIDRIISVDQNGNPTASGTTYDQKTTVASTTESTIITADAAMKNHLYALVLTNTSATAVVADIRSTTGGTIRETFAIPAGDTRGFMLANTSALKQAALNTNWTIQLRTAVTSIEVTAQYSKST